MSLYVRNNTNSTLYVAFGYYDLGCRPTTYRKAGWYAVAPGETRRLWRGYAGGQTFYYYAENASGTLEWSGSYPTRVPDDPFNWCWDQIGPNTFIIRMNRVSVGLLNYDFTLNFNASSRRSGYSKSSHSVLPTKRRSKLILTPEPVTKKLRKGTPILARRTSRGKNK